MLSLKFAHKLMLGCIVSNCDMQAILRVQIDTIFELWVLFGSKIAGSSISDHRQYYTRSIKLNSSFWGRKDNLHFEARLTNPLLPYTIRLMSLNLLLFPSANPELSGLDIAFLTGAVSCFIPLQNDFILLSPYVSMNTSVLFVSHQNPLKFSKCAFYPYGYWIFFFCHICIFSCRSLKVLELKEQCFRLWNAPNSLPLAQAQGRRADACVILGKSYSEAALAEGVDESAVRRAVK